MRLSLSSKLLAAASIVAIAPAAWAQGAATETVVVTGSRVISDIQNSPTPLTVVTTEQLQATTPTDIPDALNKLPVFAGSSTQRSLGNAGSNSPGNVLNLRNFGSNRTLILLDFHRVPASNSNGTTDIDTLPQMLMSRVDVLTGGASAAYGSDAVTGVVNFVLDKHFSGMKYNASGGISSHGLGANYQAGVALGTDFAGGKAHIEGAFRLFHSDPVRQLDLPYGPTVWEASGNGTSPLTPITATPNGRVNWAPNGLVVACGTGCTVNNMQFVAPGILGGFNAGTPTTTNGLVSGGDGGYAKNTEAQAGLKTYESFVRASYNLDNDTSMYIQAIAGQSQNESNFYDGFIVNGAVPANFFKNNPFLPAATQAQLNTGTGSTFTINRILNEVSGERNRGINRNLDFTVGADGTLMDNYAWDVFYTHGENRLAEDNIGNPNEQKYLAAEDAVTNAAGQIVCFNTTAAAGAASQAAYAGCSPINPFGGGTVPQSVYNYITDTTIWHQTQVLDNVGGSVSGNVFDLPAGPIKASLSGEARWNTLETITNASPLAKADCTGLRLCNLASLPPLYQNNTLAGLPEVSQSVWEFALEANAPLLKDLPLIQSFDVNMAGRYTDYSASGSVQTWKVGLDWHVSDDIRLRGTTSVDIRAPTLIDLFGPVAAGSLGFVDIHTGTNGITISQSGGGNPKLVPEIARTYTAGVVMTPTFIPDLTVSVDWYQINMHNAIGNVAGTSVAVQNLCEASKPAFDSPFCSLYIRPLGPQNTTPANYPTLILSQSLNAAYTGISGVDIEVDYRFALEDVLAGMDGNVSLRELFSMQPVNESQQFTGAPFTFTAQPKARSSTFINYTVGNWAFTIQDNWLSGWKKASNLTTIYYTVPRVVSYNIVDLNITKKMSFESGTADVYLAINNIFDAPGPLYPTNNANPGFSYPVPGGYPVLGRVFTLGIRGTL